MKKIIVSLLIAFTFINANAQNSNPKLIIDVTSTDFKVYQSVLLTVKMMAEQQADLQIDVIVYGEAVPMLMKNRSAVKTDIAKYALYENITFSACEISMSLFNIKKEELISGVRTINNAVDEIIKKQGLNWAYIKSGN